MRPDLPTRVAALIFLPAVATGAGVAAASATEPEQTGSITRSLIPGTPSSLGDLHAVAAERRAALQRRRAARRERLAHALRFPVGGPAGFGEAAARFGNNRGSHVHQGQDVFAPAGTPLRAIASGVVTEAGGGDARGNHVALFDRARRRTYVYFHMQAPTPLRVGQRVRAGQRVGRVGCTGRCFGDHLHFEVRLGRSTAGRAIDPMGMLSRARRAARH